MHQVLVEAAVSVTERVGPEGVDLELAGETVVRLIQVAMTGYEETRLQESFNSLGEEGVGYTGRDGGGCEVGRDGGERQRKRRERERHIDVTDTNLIFLCMYNVHTIPVTFYSANSKVQAIVSLLFSTYKP